MLLDTSTWILDSLIQKSGDPSNHQSTETHILVEEPEFKLVFTEMDIAGEWESVQDIKLKNFERMRLKIFEED